jgi:hypothetical protein
MSDTIPAHYLSVTLLCAYQKAFEDRVDEFEKGQAVVSDVWNAIHVCTSKKAAALYLKNDCGWDIPNHQLLAFMSTIWMYKIHVEKHEIRAAIHIAVNKF